MNALNEVNKVISSVSYYTHRHGNPEEEEWLTAERMAVSSDSNFMVMEHAVSIFFFFYVQLYQYNKPNELCAD